MDNDFSMFDNETSGVERTTLQELRGFEPLENEKKQKQYNSLSVDNPSYKWLGNINEIKERYKECCLLKWVNGKPLEGINYPQYFQYELLIDNVALIHKRLLESGFIRAGTKQEVLNTLKIPQLKEILRKSGMPTSGKKAELIESISDYNIKFETTDPAFYVLSDIGKEHLNLHKPLVDYYFERCYNSVNIREFAISWSGLLNEKSKQITMPDIMFPILDYKILTDFTQKSRSARGKIFELYYKSKDYDKAFLAALDVCCLDLVAYDAQTQNYEKSDLILAPYYANFVAKHIERLTLDVVHSCCEKYRPLLLFADEEVLYILNDYAAFGANKPVKFDLIKYIKRFNLEYAFNSGRKCDFGESDGHCEEGKMEKSYFDGKVSQEIGWGIVCFFITLFSAGLLYPVAVCIQESWKAKHTVIEGRRLVFTGTVGSLYGHYIMWWIFTIFTAGIYLFWLNIAVKKWKVSHTHFQTTVDENRHFFEPEAQVAGVRF